MSGSGKKGAAAFGVGIVAAGATAAVTVVGGLALMAGGWWWFAPVGDPDGLEPDLAFADPGAQVEVAAPIDTAEPQAVRAQGEAQPSRPASRARQGRERPDTAPQPARSRARPEQAAAPSPAPAGRPPAARSREREAQAQSEGSRPPVAAPAPAGREAPAPPDDPAVAEVEAPEPSSMRPDRARPEAQSTEAQAADQAARDELDELIAEDTPPMAPPPQAPQPAAPQPLATRPVEEGDWSLRTLVNQGIALLTGDPVPANEPEGMPDTRTRPKVQQPALPEPAAEWAGADGTHAPAAAPAPGRSTDPSKPAAAPAPAARGPVAAAPSPDAGRDEAPRAEAADDDGVAVVEEPTKGRDAVPPPAATPAPAPSPPSPSPAPAAPPRPMGTLEALVAGGMGMMTGQAMEDKAPQRTRTRSKVDEATADYVDPVDGGEMLELGADELAPIDLAKTDPASAFATNEPEADGWDEGPSPLDDLDVTVHIKTDTPGVPVMIDGKSVGVTPQILDLSDEEHIVKLGPGGMGGTFAISPLGDPDSWCFTESAGKYKQALCK